MSTPERPRRPSSRYPSVADWKRWGPAGAALIVLAVVAIAGFGGGGKGDGLPSKLGAINDPSLTVPADFVDPVVIATDPAAPKTTLTGALRYGSSGADVQMVQQRLTDLKFAPGPIDGHFGKGTQQAVWAFEKLVMKVPRADATGVVTNAMWQVMQDNLIIAPRRSTGAGTTHMEIYLPEQVAAVFTDDVATLITHISSGEENPDRTPKTWCETVNYDTDEFGNKLAERLQKAVCAEAKTPGGIFQFTRRYDGKREGPLGGMTNPVYFNYGIAVHGADNVPAEPASHGCVRFNQNIATFFPSLVKNGDRVYVWGEDGKQPEQYTHDESLPSFNRPDPNATTTTSSTTTTSTTIAATTTTKVPKSTTTVPVTTVKAPPTTTTTTTPTTPVTTTTVATPSATTTG
jgi:hypothetical protein